MSLNRREFLQMLAAASAAGFQLNAQASDASATVATKGPSNPYELPAFGNVSVMHYTDCHAQLKPIYFREPNINLGIADMNGRPPHLVGKHFLDHYGIAPDSLEAHAFTYLNFEEAAQNMARSVALLI